MEINNFIQILSNPQKLDSSALKGLKNAVEEYSYFQSARVLYLKALKNQESFRYNNELKVTAAYTADRTILFDFITSKIFEEHQITSEEKEEIYNADVSDKLLKVKKELQIGTPFTFGKNETHSFSEWLQLSAKETIDRVGGESEKVILKADAKSIQDSIIEKFIANNPKISRLNKTAPIEVKQEQKLEPSQLMTETLAKIYLEQKKYDNAIKAYKILSLKYPEKSSFFADQIKRIQILQNNR